jgi:hypothetical protein
MKILALMIIAMMEHAVLTLLFAMIITYVPSIIVMNAPVIMINKTVMIKMLVKLIIFAQLTDALINLKNLMILTHVLMTFVKNHTDVLILISLMMILMHVQMIIVTLHLDLSTLRGLIVTIMMNAPSTHVILQLDVFILALDVLTKMSVLMITVTQV